MFVFGPLSDIVVIISILVQSLFFCICTHTCSPDGILFILSHLSLHVIRIFTHSCDYDVHFCGSSIGFVIFPIPHSVGLCSFYLGCVLLNIDHNFVKHGRLFIFSCPNIVSSFIGIVILCLNFVHYIVCPVIFSLHELFPLSLGYSCTSVSL